MAVAFRAAGTYQAGTGDVSPGVPAGTTTNDILLLVCESSGQAISAPAGYTEVTGSPQQNEVGPSSTAVTLAMFWKRAGASESAPTVTDAGNHTAAQLFAFSGCITTGNPWDVTSANLDDAGGTTVSITGATTTVAGCLIFIAETQSLPDAIGTAEYSGWANADLTNVTERSDNTTDAGNGGAMGTATGEKATAGAYGATTVTIATTTARKAFMTVALKPDDTGPQAKDFTDTGAGTEALTIEATADIADTGSGADAFDGGLAALLEDTGAGIDTFTLESATIEITDAGVGTDALVLLEAEHILAESGVGVDDLVMEGGGTFTDSGSGNDAWDVFAAAAFQAMFGGVDRSAVLDLDSFRIEESAANIATADWMMVDRAGTIANPLDLEVEFLEYGIRIFGGFAREAKKRLIGPTLLYEGSAVDYNTLLDEQVVVSPSIYTTSMTDKVLVQTLIADHDDKGITAGAFVQTVYGTLPPDEDGNREYNFSGRTLKEALEQVADLIGAEFYVDCFKNLHWFPAGNEGLAAPFDLSDNANGTTLREHYDLEFPNESRSYRDAVYIVGDGIEGWYPDPPPAAATRRAAPLPDSNVTTQAELNARGAGFLAEHSRFNGGSCTILDSGVHVGMTIQVTSAKYGLSATPFMVEKVVWHLENRLLPVYELIIGKAPPSLAAILARMRRQETRRRHRAQDIQDTLLNIKIAGRNRIKNSAFDDDFDDWANGTGWTIFSTIDALFGDKVARLQRSGNASGDLVHDDYVKVNRNRDWQFSAHVWVQTYTSGTIRIELREYNNANTLLATTTIADITDTDDDWERYIAWFGPTTKSGGRKAFHASTIKIKINVRTVGSATLDAWYSGVEAEEGTHATEYAPAPKELRKLIVEEKHLGPESVATDKVKPGAITGTRVANGAIDFNQLANEGVGSVKARDNEIPKIVADVDITTGLPGPGAYAQAAQTTNLGISYRPRFDAYVVLASGLRKVSSNFNISNGIMHFVWDVDVSKSGGSTRINAITGRSGVAGTPPSRTFKIVVFKEQGGS